MSTWLEVWQYKLFQMRVEEGVEQTLGSQLVVGSSSKGQTKVGGGRGVTVVA